MIRLNCDYSEGAHISILNKLLETNMEQTPVYGEDIYCKQAARLIKELCQQEDAEVHFLVGGTQANLTVIASALRPHQCVVCADTGHINTHETGAIEACGHKVVTVRSNDGKITAEQVLSVYRSHYDDEVREHITQPKMVFISNPTELGTIYYKEELEAISKVCRENQLYLYMDGARLGYGLCAQDNDLDLPTIARCCDVFYIGGTKVGALFGEAVVITNSDLKQDFRYIMKQKGGLLAKGRLLGIQFLELFKDGLYFKLASHANRLAVMIKNAFIEKGYSLLVDSYTNQQFVILPDSILDKLAEKYTYAYHERIDEKHSAVRFCTSWATNEADVLQFLDDIKRMG
ncbi:MAG: threonine aldolase family protein [Syntrophomonadaceae bacterium]